MSPSDVFSLHQARFREAPNPPLAHRINRLKALKAELLRRESDLQAALWTDFRKPRHEVELTEILATLIELDHAIRHLRKWIKPHRSPTPLVLIGTSTHVQSLPKGPSLIIAPWNYAVLLTLGPVIHATAAGCPFVVKPSELTPETGTILEEIIRAVYPEDEAAVFQGGPDMAKELLSLPFGHIHFTGSPRIGKIIMKAASEHLASVTLELGGKSPTYIDRTADLDQAAHGICFGKFSNAGQTCIAPDYLLVHKDVAAGMEAALVTEIKRAYVAGSGDSDMAGIVAEGHATRQQALLADAVDRGARIAVGGDMDAADRRMQATVLVDVPDDARVMQEEIFGPILPLVVVNNVSEAIDIILSKPPPLSTYVYSNDDAVLQTISERVRTGAVCRNTTLLQFVQPFGPFGGEGNSGIGRSHGEAGFKAFSNEQVVLRRRWGSWILRLLQPPYSDRTSTLSRLFRRFT